MRQYKSFDSEESALPLVEALRESGLDFEIEKTRNYLDSVLVGDLHSKFQIVIKLYQADFAKVDGLVEDLAKKWIEVAPKDHYLFAFEDAELLDIAENKADWSLEDYFLARHILGDRGVSIDDEKIKEEADLQLLESRKSQKASLALLIFGYLAPSLGLAIITEGVFYFLAFVVGGFLILARKTDRTGRRFYFYDSQSRKHGLAMIVIWTILLAFLFLTGKLYWIWDFYY